MTSHPSDSGYGWEEIWDALDAPEPVETTDDEYDPDSED